MTTIRLRYIHRFADRHGKLRYYFRRHGRRVPLPGLPGSGEFMAAYQAALADQQAPEIGAERTIPGSMSALIVAWYRSADFKQLRDLTKSTYRGIVERFRTEHGSKPVKALAPRHVRRIVAAKAETPAAANNLLKVLRLLLRFALEDGWRNDDPTVGVRMVRHRSEGFHAWTDAEISAFEAAYPIGTRECLALALLLYTGCRRSDVVTLGWQHVDGDRLTYTQKKTGVRVTIPQHPALAEVLAALPREQLTFLVTAQGKPFTPTGFYNWFTERARTAGLPPGCSPHGLRKAMSRRLAEAGCTPHQVQSVTGHRTLKEVERYTEDANRLGLAKDAITSLGRKREQ